MNRRVQRTLWSGASFLIILSLVTGPRMWLVNDTPPIQVSNPALGSRSELLLGQKLTFEEFLEAQPQVQQLSWKWSYLIQLIVPNT